MESLLANLRQSMYEPIAGLAAGVASLADIGIAVGASGGAGTSQAALEGQLTLDTSKLSEAVKANPEGVQKLLQQWAQGLQSTLTQVAQAGGTLEARINGDSSQVTELSRQIDTMNEMLAAREKALQATYAQLEGVLSQNSSQVSWLASQEASLTASGL